MISAFLLASVLARGEPIARPTAAHLRWQSLEVGLFIHFAPNTWSGLEYDDVSVPLSSINPTEFSASQWVDAAVACGAKYIVLVAKHTGGFCLWPTDTSPYGIKETPFQGGKGDIVGDLSRACRERGLAFGIYLSPRDDTHKAGLGGKCADDETQAAYNRVYRDQLTDLLTRYGPVVEVWFDGSLVVPVGDILKEHAAEAMIFQGPHATIRWVGNEAGYAPYPAWNAVRREDAETGIATAVHGDPLGERWLPLEVDVSLRRPNWFWNKDNHVNILSLDELMRIYYGSVGRGCQLLLNVTPDTRGRIPEPDMARLRELGQEVSRRFSRPLGEATGALSARIDFASPTVIDHLVIQEDLAGGERVRQYRVQGLSAGQWTTLAEGTAIGYKRIQALQPATVDAVVLEVLAAAGEPKISRFAAFQSGPPPERWDHQPDELWSEDEMGRWKDGFFEIDLSSKWKEARVYRVRFVGIGGEAQPQDIRFRVGEVDRTDLVRPDPERPDWVLVTVTEAAEKLVLRGRIQGASAGRILAR